MENRLVSPAGPEQSTHWRRQEQPNPRSLAAAYLKPVGSGNQAEDSISALESFRDRIDAAYGPCAEETYSMNVESGSGNLADLPDFRSDLVYGFSTLHLVCADGFIWGGCSR